jgi:hypothetical protein
MLSAAAPPRRGLSTRRLLAACPCQHQGAACPPSPLDLECLLQTDEPNRNLAIGRLARSEDDRLSGDRSVDTARSRGRSLRSGAVQAVSAKGKRDKQDARPTTIIFSPPSRVFLQPSSHRDWRVRSGNRDRHGTLSEGTVVRAWLDNLAEVFLRPSHDHREFGEQSAAFRGPFAPDDFRGLRYDHNASSRGLGGKTTSLVRLAVASIAAETEAVSQRGISRRGRLHRRHLQMRRSAGANPPVRGRQCHADPLQGPAQTQGLGLRDRQAINDAQSASRSGSSPRDHYARDAARRNGLYLGVGLPTTETGDRIELPQGATPEGREQTTAWIL